MEIPALRWLSAISTRRSRRQYNGMAIAQDMHKHLSKFCAEFKPFPHARSVLVNESPKRLFKGIIGPYGKIKGAPAFVALIGNMDSPNVQEETGYTGEGVILEAEALNLATCWVGGFFRREVASSFIKMTDNERIIAVTPVGYSLEHKSLEERLMTGFGWTHRRKYLSTMVAGLKEAEWPEWIRASLKAAMIAPSAVNRQPWCFKVEPDSIMVSVNKPGIEFNVAKRLDCGIAMLHIEVAALSNNIQGKWEFWEAPHVARFHTLNDN
ncbi:nitroreductase family protein [Chloroflexota bacterium]